MNNDQIFQLILDAAFRCLQQKPVFFFGAHPAAQRATSPVTGLGQWGHEEIWSQFSQDRGQQGRNASTTKGAAAGFGGFF